MQPAGLQPLGEIYWGTELSLLQVLLPSYLLLSQYSQAAELPMQAVGLVWVAAVQPGIFLLGPTHPACLMMLVL